MYPVIENNAWEDKSHMDIYLWISAETIPGEPVCDPQTWQPGQDEEGQDLGKMGREAKLPDINLSNLTRFSYHWLIIIALVDGKH